MKIAKSSSGARCLGTGSANLPSPLLGTHLSIDRLAALSSSEVCRCTYSFNPFVVARIVACRLSRAAQRRSLDVLLHHWDLASELPCYAPGPDCMDSLKAQWLREAVEEGRLQQELLLLDEETPDEEDEDPSEAEDALAEGEEKKAPAAEQALTGNADSAQLRSCPTEQTISLGAPVPSDDASSLSAPLPCTLDQLVQAFAPLLEKLSIVVKGDLYNMHDNNIIHK